MVHLFEFRFQERRLVAGGRHALVRGEPNVLNSHLFSTFVLCKNGWSFFVYIVIYWMAAFPKVWISLHEIISLRDAVAGAKGLREQMDRDSKGGFRQVKTRILNHIRLLFKFYAKKSYTLSCCRSDNAVKNRFTTLCKKRAKREALAKENSTTSYVNLNNKRVVFRNGLNSNEGSENALKKIRYGEFQTSVFCEKCLWFDLLIFLGNWHFLLVMLMQGLYLNYCRKL